MQTIKKSLVEQLTRTGLNYFLSVLSYTFIFPDMRLSKGFLIGLYFIVLSLTTGFVIRRVFNKYD